MGKGEAHHVSLGLVLSMIRIPAPGSCGSLVFLLYLVVAERMFEILRCGIGLYTACGQLGHARRIRAARTRAACPIPEWVMVTTCAKGPSGAASHGGCAGDFQNMQVCAQARRDGTRPGGACRCDQERRRLFNNSEK